MYLDSRTSSSPLKRRLRRLSLCERIEEADAFIKLFHSENNLTPELCKGRMREVRRSLKQGGYYEHTSEELAFGARVAWRNHARCVGRLHWKSLDIFDCRNVTRPEEIASQVAEHMQFAASGKSIRSAISIFAPVMGKEIPGYIENRQVLQYAGYLLPDQSVIGDPLNIEFTRIAQSLGWERPRNPTSFDILPLIVRDSSGLRHMFELPANCRKDVAIEHPTALNFTDLGLRWYTVPCVSDLILTIGGIDYPCAPFNGHYMATEIASRDLIDENRYDMLDKVRVTLGLPLADPLWKDTALTELNRAVLHSFRVNNATICDHHSASAQFLEFNQLEKAAGRAVSAQWDWIVPPQAPAACQTYHLPMQNLHDVPNFYKSRASDGFDLYPSRETEHMSRWERRRNRLARRIRRWLRQNIK